MNIGIIGYGKMGKEIEQIAIERGHKVALKIGSANLDELNNESLRTIDVAIEFTNPENAIKNMELCFDSKVPVVVGTTGWYDSFDAVKQYCEHANGTLLYATNCSIGVHIFFKLNERLAQLMRKQSDYSVKIEETHHTQKLDAPSGTAITLAEGVLSNHELKNKWINNLSEESDELSILSHRVENVPGTHVINYQSTIDEIEITHTAHNRKGFALGAVVAAEYIHNKKGIFTMSDVLFD